MKRFLTTLAILLVVILAGLTTLVLLINPNDFRGYLIERVEKQSGYKLTLQDDMRWHVWPKLSIISGKMSLTAPGAEKPLIAADNMRLDVELWPLLSHQLEVKEVMLKGAVVLQTPESQPVSKTTSSSAKDVSRPVIEPKTNRWQLNIAKVNISDSLVIWQMNDGEQLNFRDINLSLKTDEKQQIKLDLNTKLSRDRREFAINLSANADMSTYPYQVNGNITQFDYALSGVGIPEKGIQGSLSSDFKYKNDVATTLVLNNVNITANDSQLQGDINAVFADKNRYDIKLQGEQLDLNTLLPELAKEKSAQTAVLVPAINKQQNVLSSILLGSAYAAPAPNATIMTRPVISAIAQEHKDYDLTALGSVELNIALAINKLIYKELEINDFKLVAENKPKSLNIDTLTGKILNGDFSLPTVISTSIVPAHISMGITMNNLPLQPLLRVFSQPENFSGFISAKGHLEGDGYQRQAFFTNWQGTLDTSLKQFTMQGLNIPQVIQQSIAQATDKVIDPEEISSYTQAESVVAQFKLAPKGLVTINGLNAKADNYNIKGQGKLNLEHHNLDMMLLVNIKKGWGKENEFTRQLAKIELPLRLYGNWSAIQYEFNVDKLLRDKLQQKAKQAIDDWLSKQDDDAPEAKVLNKLLDKL